MAKFLKEIQPTEKSYLVELTQSEVDVIMGIVSDLCDNPQRKVSMVYAFDESVSTPTDRGMETLNGILNGLGILSGGELDYDYDDYWDTYSLEEFRYRTT